ncbi:MAG TPA: type II secretion system major pseudopilin GspG [Phycisphaerales bacterium]|nr:type II secretion system major pseudopilin GspG [Phycisphaerales bacterium]
MSRSSLNVVRRGVARASGRGFTLIELLIVIAIIAALGGLVTVAVLGRKKEATAQLAVVDLNTIKKAMKEFNFNFDRYPTDEEGVEVLWNKEKLSPDADQAKWKKFLEEPMPTDRWGTPWGYRQVSEHGDEETFDLWSFGPNKLEGDDDDVKSWKDEEAGEGGGSGAGSGSSGGGSGG